MLQFVYKVVTLQKISQIRFPFMKIMLRKTFIILSILFVVFSASARNKTFVVDFHHDATDNGIKLFVQPLVSNATLAVTEMQMMEDGRYRADVPFADKGFYHLVYINGGVQLIAKIYEPGENVLVDIAVELVGNKLIIDNTPENKALSFYSGFVADNGRRLWNAEPSDEATVKDILERYITVADSVIATTNCESVVEEYMKVWSYTSAYNGMHSAEINARRANHELTFKRRDILGDYEQILDNDMSALFFETFSMIDEELRGYKTLAEKFGYLHGKYTNDSLRLRVRGSLIDKFISRHDYNNDFEGGLAQLSEAVEKYGVDKKYITEYNRRRAMIKGAVFPQGVELMNAAGDTIDFAMFKGKYVYIDMWASWCGPCCKEIPHLQKLEKELQNDNVAFVSISIDKDTEAWKKKMIEYNMEGNQFVDSNNTLGQALNVRGIPFFVIYDKEGKLFMHGAPRPSHGVALKEMLEGLE